MYQSIKSVGIYMSRPTNRTKFWVLESKFAVCKWFSAACKQRDFIHELELFAFRYKNFEATFFCSLVKNYATKFFFLLPSHNLNPLSLSLSVHINVTRSMLNGFRESRERNVGMTRSDVRTHFKKERERVLEESRKNEEEKFLRIEKMF